MERYLEQQIQKLKPKVKPGKVLRRFSTVEALTIEDIKNSICQE